ncbi:hypothetical protein Pelo_4898 [Pelomyxa schiedti]|nr:hypothetical protein Pelo_4898 [Pelomyxa schiedti]
MSFLLLSTRSIDHQKYRGVSSAEGTGGKKKSIVTARSNSASVEEFPIKGMSDAIGMLRGFEEPLRGIESDMQLAYDIPHIEKLLRDYTLDYFLEKEDCTSAAHRTVSFTMYSTHEVVEHAKETFKEVIPPTKLLYTFSAMDAFYHLFVEEGRPVLGECMSEFWKLFNYFGYLRQVLLHPAQFEAFFY